MSKQKKEKKESKPEEVKKKTKDSRKEKKKKNEKKEIDKKSKKKKEQSKKQIVKSDEIDLNVYNLLFDDVNLFMNELGKISTKEIKQRLILIDGKMLWIEKESEEELLVEEGGDEIIDIEMEMLEMGLDLDDAAEELALSQEATAGDFDLEAIKTDLEETKSFGDSIKDLIKEIEEDDLEKPIDELASKFLLFDLRAILERAINEVFKIEGKIKEMMKEGEDKMKIKNLFVDQRIAVKRALKDILDRLKKQKPSLIMDEGKIKQFKALNEKEIAAMKAKEEQEFDQMVEGLLDQ
ncbi:MAG: hypothetical protein EAX90_13670 [Candidatus Heimdallarchaeota archaeon]|nr:hypothetical protein [Candidatus Heimdallarchaeota archaeon]